MKRAVRCGVCGASVRVECGLAGFVVLCRFCLDPQPVPPAPGAALMPFAPVVLPPLPSSPRLPVFGDKPPVPWFDPEDARTVDDDMKRWGSEMD